MTANGATEELLEDDELGTELLDEDELTLELEELLEVLLLEDELELPAGQVTSVFTAALFSGPPLRVACPLTSTPHAALTTKNMSNDAALFGARLGSVQVTVPLLTAHAPAGNVDPAKALASGNGNVTTAGIVALVVFSNLTLYGS